MAKLRKWCAYRTFERPYTRFSKYRKKAFVKSRPGKKVIKFDMGDLKGGPDQFPVYMKLISKDMILVRANAIEAARIASLRLLEASFGKTGFYYRVLMVPHHAIRENPLAAGAGADRLSTGMKHSFGKIIGTAARVEKNKVLIELYTTKSGEAIGRAALKKATKKLPLKTTIETTFRKAIELTEEQIAAKKDAAKKAAARDKKKAELEAAEAEKTAATDAAAEATETKE
ncbi:MAG: 50S ribosomal protein L16 [Nanoarchaeota archaeon]|nr:50S ribosomal protein L16 [Nanoarchaeota archaeon]